MARNGGGSASPINVLSAITLSGNTTGTLALVSSGTFTLAGGSNITLSQQGNRVTIIGGAGGGGGGSFSAGVSNVGNTSGNTGTVSNQIVLAGGNNITLSQGTGAGGATVTISAGAQTTQPGIQALSAGTQTATTGTVTLSNANGVSFGLGSGASSNVVTGSVAAGATATGNLGSVVFSNQTVSSGGLTITGSNAATVKSSAGPTVVIDVPTGASATGNFGAIAGSNATYSSGTVTLTGVGGGVTVSSNTGQRIDISVAAQTTQTQNLHNVTLSGNTAGAMAQISSGTMTIAGGNNVTLSQAGNAVTISGAAQTAQTQNVHNLTLSGNTAGAMAQVSSGTLTLAGGNNITLSQAGNAITISGAAAAGAQTAISGIAASNTTYTSGSVTFSGVGGGVTVSSNTGQRVDISVAAPVAQTVQTQNLHAVTLSGNTAGVMALASSGTVTWAGGNNITLSQNGNAITISGANVGGAQTGISGIAASNTTYTSGSVTFSGVGGGITVSSNTGQRIDLSVAAPVAQTVQTQNVVVPAGSNTTYTSGTVVFTGSNAVTVRSTTGQAIVIDVPTGASATGNLGSIAWSNTTVSAGGLTITGSNAATVKSGAGPQLVIDVPIQTLQTSNVHNVTLSGNTAGVMAQVSSGTLTLAGGNNITLSQNGNAVTISGAAGGGAGFSAGVSTGGNTAGATGITGTRLVFVGTNNITLSQTTDANGGTISISGAGGGAGAFSGGVSNLGNSSGSTGITGTQMVLVGGNNVTLSQSTGANGGTVTVSGPPLWSIPSFSYWDNAPFGGTATAALTSGAPVNRQFYVFPITPLDDVFPGNMTVSTMRIGLSGSQAATTSTLAYTLSIYGGLYTLNGSSLSLLNSFSTALSTGANNASISTGLQGHRWLSLHSSQWSAAPSFSQTYYWLGLAFSTAGESKQISSIVFRGANVGSAIRSGEMGVSFTTGSSTMLHQAFNGIYTATTAAPPTSISKGQIAIPGNTLSAGAIPHVVFDNLGILV